MINFDDVTNENLKEHNPNWHIPEHPYEILIIGGPRSGKANSLFNLINHQLDIDKIYLYAKDRNKAKYQFLVKNREAIGTKHVNGSKTFIEYSNNMDSICRNIEEYNPNKKRKILAVFDDMITDMHSKKILNPIVTELLIRGRKLNISLFLLHNLILMCQKIID